MAIKKFIAFIFSFTLLITNLSCKKEKRTTRQIQEFWDCSGSVVHDSVLLAEGLIGSWRWTEFPTKRVKFKSGKQILVTFESDRSFKVIEDGKPSVAGKWTFKTDNSGVYMLKMSIPSIYLYGYILLCGDRVLFHKSALETGSNLFIRIE
jgi:hypothetical protein